MPWAPIALGVAGIGLSAYGMVKQGEASGATAAYQAQVAANNAKTAQQNADYAVQAGQVDAANQSQKGAVALAHTKVAQAANGLDVNSGSAVKVRAGQAETNTLDTETTMQNALLKAYGYKTAAVSDTAQAGLDQNAAETIPIGADIGAGATLLGGASSLGFKWSGSQNPSSFTDSGGSYGGTDLPGFGNLKSA